MCGFFCDISDFEMKVFFIFDGVECDVINVCWGDFYKFGLVFYIGFLCMSGCLFGVFWVILVVLWCYFGNEFGIVVLEVVLLRVMYECGCMLFDY